jgi:hypothetical protein
MEVKGRGRNSYCSYPLVDLFALTSRMSRLVARGTTDLMLDHDRPESTVVAPVHGLSGVVCDFLVHCVQVSTRFRADVVSHGCRTDDLNQ